MSCHGCSAAFGFLNRERGCPKCGFAFCKKCLKYKIPKSEKENSTLLVCRQCNEMVNSNSDGGNKKMNRQLSFSETTQVIKAMHRLQSLENPAKPPIVVYSKESQEDIDSLRIGLTPEDQVLVDRLANLRNERKKRRQSEDPAEDIALRLAHLRGDSASSSDSASRINSLLVSKKPETEEDLVSRLANEASLDRRYDDSLTADLEERLGRLRGPLTSQKITEPCTQTEAMHIDPVSHQVLTEEEEVKQIIERFQKEVELEKAIGMSPEEDAEIDVADSSGDEDSPMCRICDGKALLLCKECDGDEFCRGCFAEFHREIGETHKSSEITRK